MWELCIVERVQDLGVPTTGTHINLTSNPYYVQHMHLIEWSCQGSTSTLFGTTWFGNILVSTNLIDRSFDILYGVELCAL